MTTLSVRHTVSDFDTWKSAFDSHEPARRSHGATEHRVVRDGNDIEVLIDFPTVDFVPWKNGPVMRSQLSNVTGTWGVSDALVGVGSSAVTWFPPNVLARASPLPSGAGASGR